MPLTKAEQGAHDGGQQPEHLERGGYGAPMAEALAEDRPVDPRDAIQRELDHDAGEQYAYGCGRHCMRVGEPEVERNDGALDQQARDDQHERHHDEPVGPVPGDVRADLRHVQRASAPVDQGDARQRQVGPDAVGNREVQRALNRAALIGAVRGQRVGDHAHGLEPDEHVKDIAGQAKADHAGQERQHERVVIGRDLLEVPPGEHHGRCNQHCREQCEPGVERADLEIDADGDPVRLPEIGEPVDLVAARRPRHDHREHGRDRDCRGDRDPVQQSAPWAQQPAEAGAHRRARG